MYVLHICKYFWATSSLSHPVPYRQERSKVILSCLVDSNNKLSSIVSFSKPSFWSLSLELSSRVTISMLFSRFFSVRSIVITSLCVCFLFSLSLQLSSRVTISMLSSRLYSVRWIVITSLSGCLGIKISMSSSLTISVFWVSTCSWIFFLRVKIIWESIKWRNICIASFCFDSKDLIVTKIDSYSWTYLIFMLSTVSITKDR